MANILIVEDDVPFGTMLKTFLIKRDYEVELVFSGLEAFKKLKENSFNLILSDVRLPDTSGLDILKEVKAENADTQVIIMTSYAEISMAVEAMKIGAFDYVSKPFRPESILQTIKNALTHTEVQQPSAPKQAKKPQKPASAQENSFVKGVSEAAIKLTDYIELVAPTNMSVLIMGESGTGK